MYGVILWRKFIIFCFFEK